MSLPEPLLAAINGKWYTPGDSDISVSGLISPPRLRVLTDKHKPEEDPLDMIWRVLGSATHAMVERAAEGLDGWLMEERLYTHVGGWDVGGQIDWYNVQRKELWDLKVTSAWSVLKGEPKPEWVAQTNCYAQLLRENGHDPACISVACILRDWTKSKAADSDTYPQQQVVTLDIPVWSSRQCCDYMGERVALHQQAQQAADNGDPLPRCTDAEMWTRPGKTAAMKKGRKRAMKLFDTQAEAVNWRTRQTDASEIYLEDRPAVYPRCGTGKGDGYCAVYEWCNQAKGR